MSSSSSCFDDRLFEAAGHDDITQLSAILSSHSHLIDTPNPTVPGRPTPMHRAVAVGQVRAMELLVKAGSRAVDTPDDNGCTPMHVAAQNGDISVIYALVRHGSTSSLDAPDHDGHTPIHHAARHGRRKAIEALVRIGSRAIDAASSRDGSTAMHLAAMEGHDDVIETLVRLGSRALDRPAHNGSTPMHAAAASGHARAMEAIVRLGGRVIDVANANGWTPLHLAAQTGHSDAVRTLVRLGSQAYDAHDHQGLTPLALAIENRSEGIVSLLLEAGADIPTAVQASRSTRVMGACRELALAGTVPALRLMRYYEPWWDMLALHGADLTNETAALLPLANWKTCAAYDFGGNPKLTEIPASLAAVEPTAARRSTNTLISFDLSAEWSTLEMGVIRGNDPRHVIEYARLKASGMQSVNERKVVLGGYLGVGKTTLIRRLKDELNQQQQQQQPAPLSTDGVEMTELTLRGEHGEAMKLAIWDFAGQPLYRQTHLLFLRNPGLCLLLFKLTDEVDKCVDQLRYWCETLRSLTAGSACGTSSRLLLAGTHLDRCPDRNLAKHHALKVRKRLLDFFPVIEQPLLVSCADGAEHKQTIANLRAAVLRIAQGMDVRAPACIETVRNALLPVVTSSVPLLSGAAAHEIISNYGSQVNHTQLANDAKLRETCLRALQTLGSVLVVEEQRTTTASGTGGGRGRITHVVVNPQWVALLLATVVTTRHTWVTRGRVTYGTLSSQVWRGNGRFPVGIHNTLATILEQLKIMFAVDKDKRQGGTYHPDQVFFIPSSLPEQRANVRFGGLGRYRTDIMLDGNNTNNNTSNTNRGNGSGSGSQSSRLRRLFKLTEQGASMPGGVVPVVVAQIMALPRTKLLEAWQHGGVFRIKSSSSPSSSSTQSPMSSSSSSAVIVSVCKWSADTIEVIVQAEQGQFGSKWIRDVSGMVENQLAGLYHLPFEVRVPCWADPESCYVLLSDVRDCVAEEKLLVRCSKAFGSHSSRVDIVAPDLLQASSGGKAFVQPWSCIDFLDRSDSIAQGLLRPPFSSNIAPKPISVITVAQFKADMPTINQFQQEAYLMSMLEHPNIVRFVGVCLPSEEPQQEHEHGPGLLMEVVGGGTLFESLTDSVGLVKVCRMAVEVMMAVDQHNLAVSQHRAEPGSRAKPEDMGGLETLCGGAVEAIRRTFTERIAGRDSAGAEPSISAMIGKLRVLQQRLDVQLAAYHRGPMSSALLQETRQVVEQIKAVVVHTNELLVPIEWPLRLKLATDLAQGLLYLHSMAPALVHRDFKSPNVFLTQRLDTVDLSTFDWRRPLAKLGDFGLSVRLLGTNTINTINTTITSNTTISQAQRATRGSGEREREEEEEEEAKARMSEQEMAINPTWGAPEVLSRQEHSSEADVYGMGIVLWELLMREHPFSEVPMSGLAQHVIGGGRPALPSAMLTEHDETMQAYATLMQHCWHPDPDQRPLIGAVYARLRDLSRSVAPPLFSSLPDLSARASRSALMKIETAQSRYDVEQVDKISLEEPLVLQSSKNPGELPKVLCLESVGSNGFWVGLSTGLVVALELSDAGEQPQTSLLTCCKQADCHRSGVTTLCYNPSLKQSMWSGSKDGQICVWSTEIDTIEAARGRHTLTTCFLLVDTNLRQLMEVKGQVLKCVLRNGWLLCYLDATAPPTLELDMCRADLLVSVLAENNLKLAFEAMHLILRPLDELDDSFSAWHPTLSSLVLLSSTGRELTRLVDSSQSTSEYIVSFEATDEATWCLSLTSLVEWQLVETHHGLHNHVRLEPFRRLMFDMNSGPFADPKLRGVCAVAWVAPNVLWIGAANTIAFINLAQSSSSTAAASYSSSSSSSSAPSHDTSSSSSSSTSSSPLPSPTFGDDQLDQHSCLWCFRTHEGTCSDYFVQVSSDLAKCVECNESFGLFRKRLCDNCSASLCRDCFSACRLCPNCRRRPVVESSSASQQAGGQHQPAAEAAPAVMHWPAADTPCHVAGIRLLAVAKSPRSASGWEVWSYAQGEDIFVWQTPLSDDSNDDYNYSDGLEPVLLARVPLSASTPQLTRMKQVGNQMWAGMRKGDIIGWDIASREPLLRQPLGLTYPGAQAAGPPQPVSDIAMPQSPPQRMFTAISSSNLLTLRRFTLLDSSSSLVAAANKQPSQFGSPLSPRKMETPTRPSVRQAGASSSPRQSIGSQRLNSRNMIRS